MIRAKLLAAVTALGLLQAVACDSGTKPTQPNESAPSITQATATATANPTPTPAAASTPIPAPAAPPCHRWQGDDSPTTRAPRTSTMMPPPFVENR